MGKSLGPGKTHFFLCCSSPAMLTPSAISPCQWPFWCVTGIYHCQYVWRRESCLMLRPTRDFTSWPVCPDYNDTDFQEGISNALFPMAWSNERLMCTNATKAWFSTQIDSLTVSKRDFNRIRSLLVLGYAAQYHVLSIKSKVRATAH